jgi:chromosome segregation ATPase
MSSENNSVERTGDGGQDEQTTFMGMRIIKNDSVPDDEIWLIKPSGRIHKITNIEKSELAEQPKEGQDGELIKVLCHQAEFVRMTGLTTTAKMIGQACSELDAAKAEIGQLQTRINGYQVLLKNRDGRVAELRTQNSEQSQQIAELEKQLKSARGQADGYCAEYVKLKSKIAELEKQLAEANKSLVYYKGIL